MKISVLTPSFNSGQYLQRAINSVLTQDYRPCEHIIIDGGSKDETISILKSHAHLVWVSERDRGQSDAMNKAFQKSTGDIIMYLNADDELEAGALKHIAECFKMNKKADLVIGNLRINQLGKISVRKPSRYLISILRFWPARFPLNPVSYAYRRSLQEKIGPFPLENQFTMDYWFLLRAYMFGKVMKTDKILGTYHIDGNNKSSDSDRAKSNLKTVRDQFIRQYLFTPSVLGFLVIRPLLYLRNRLIMLSGKSNKELIT